MTTADDLARLFDAERAVRPPAGGLEQGLSRLMDGVAQGVAPLPIATGSLKLGVSLVSKWLLLGFVVGLAGAGAASQTWAPSAAAAPSAGAPSSGLAVSREAGSASPAASPSAEMPESFTASEVRAVGRAAAPALPSASPAADVTTFDEELRLIMAAKKELESGRAANAGAWLAEHAQRFPNGVFALDREALQILITCNKQKQPNLAQAFAANHPRSPLIARLMRACVGADAKTPSVADFSENDK